MVSGRGARRKGTDFEREIVDEAKNYGLDAKRMWGSNGRSMGFHQDVDVIIDQKKFQLKRRARFSADVKPSRDVDGQIIREDRGETFVTIRLDEYLKLLRGTMDPANSGQEEQL